MHPWEGGANKYIKYNAYIKMMIIGISENVCNPYQQGECLFKIE